VRGQISKHNLALTGGYYVYWSSNIFLRVCSFENNREKRGEKKLPLAALFSLAVFRTLSQRTEHVEEATPVLRGVGKLPQSFFLVEVGPPNN